MAVLVSRTVSHRRGASHLCIPFRFLLDNTNKIGECPLTGTHGHGTIHSFQTLSGRLPPQQLRLDLTMRSQRWRAPTSVTKIDDMNGSFGLGSPRGRRHPFHHNDEQAMDVVERGSCLSRPPFCRCARVSYPPSTACFINPNTLNGCSCGMRPTQRSSRFVFDVQFPPSYRISFVRFSEFTHT